MPRHKATGQLCLTPVEPLRTANPLSLLEFLHERRFIGAPLETPVASEAHYLVGEAFLQQITFMGCSPSMELEPPVDGSDFCHIRLLGPFAEPILMAGRNTPAPRCTRCRTPWPDWREATQTWCRTVMEPAAKCPSCAHTQRPVDLQWRRNASFGRHFLTVRDIFPGEAVPVPALLTGLANLSGCAWRYFYVRD